MGLWFWMSGGFLTSLEVVLEAREGISPGLHVSTHPPVVNTLDRHGVDVVVSKAPVADRRNESRAFQHLQVLHHSEARQMWKRLGDRSGGEPSVHEEV